MREILFRGKRVDNGEWVEGYYYKFMANAFKSSDKITEQNNPVKYMKHCIVLNTDESYKEYEVIPETISQFTGLLDKNGKKIFEGDIVHDVVFKATVEYLDNLAGYYPFSTEIKSIYSDECEIIGNKFDLEVGDVKD